jgi:hypothetical protein
MIRKLFLVSVVVACCGASARAGIVEIRGGVGLSAANADQFDEAAKAAGQGGIDANDFQTYNADLFFNIPAFPIGVGLRHDWLNLSKGSGGSDVDLKGRNLSLLVDLRLLDTPVFYLGPIVGAGYPTANVHFNNGTVSTDTDVNGKNISYNAGLEAGFYLGHFLIGAEAGYQNVEFESSSSGNGRSATFDATGFYGKAMVGLTFF